MYIGDLFILGPERSCLYHSGHKVEFGDTVWYSCCPSQRTSPDLLPHVAGCTRGRHAAQHHSSYTYSTYEDFMCKQVCVQECPEAYCIPSFVSGGTDIQFELRLKLIHFKEKATLTHSMFLMDVYHLVIYCLFCSQKMPERYGWSSVSRTCLIQEIMSG